MYDNSESKIGCPLHGWLDGTPADSEVRVGSQYRFPIKCAYCPTCNKFYTTSLAINLGRAKPVNGIPVEKGIVPGATDGQTVYAGPAVPLKTNGKTVKRADLDPCHRYSKIPILRCCSIRKVFAVSFNTSIISPPFNTAPS